MQKCIGVSSIAEYLGISSMAVYQLINRHGPDSSSRCRMPEPFVMVVQAKKSKNGKEAATYGWLPSQLADIRMWYAEQIKGWDDVTAAHKWVEVDALLKSKEHDAART
jgi:hypothetical protein